MLTDYLGLPEEAIAVARSVLENMKIKEGLVADPVSNVKSASC